MRVAYKIFFVLAAVCVAWSCSPTKYVGKDEYLLDRVKLSVEGGGVNAVDVKRNIRQRPNTRILGTVRFHLGLYNLSGRDGEKRFNRWLRRIGEEPVIYDSTLVDRSAGQIRLYLKNAGFYNSVVRDTVVFRRKRATVSYAVETGPRTVIREVVFRQDTSGGRHRRAEESGLLGNYYRDTTATLLDVDTPLDLGLLDDERERITQMLREKGYFNFSKNFVRFLADTTSDGRERRARLFVRLADELPDSNSYRRYFIRNISVNLDYDALLTARQVDSLYQSFDYEGYRVSYRGKLKIRPKVVIETIQLERMELYNAQQVVETYARLQALGLFKFVNVEFREVKDENDVRALDCHIQLTPMKRQSYDLFLEGTHNSGNLGVGGNFTYNHRNLFRGGENFSIGVWGALEKEQVNGEGKIFNSTEIGAEMRLVSPQFWLPVFRLKDFRRNYAPKTSISFSYSHETTPYYIRSIANARYGYFWRLTDKKWRFSYDPVDLNYVSMENVDSNFIAGLRNEYVRTAYTDHLIFSGVFSATYTDQDVNAQELGYTYFRMNVEASGNLLWAVDRVFGNSRTGAEHDGHNEVFGVRYAQFVKADAEFRHNWYLNRANSIVGRFVVGCGYPYGNMKVLPFEEAFYCGGANDIRAWQARTLGPGQYKANDHYPNSVGDFKLAANLEYRFKLVWILEGALFLDAGNVWNVNPSEDRPGTRLTSDFYKQIAVGTGAGLRLNANFFLLRFDLGIKLKDPSLPEGGRFVLFNSDGGFRRSVFNIAIGYPF